MEIVELCCAVCPVAEETGADALPIAGTHLEGLATGQEVLTVGAIVELMTIVQTVVGDSKVKFVETPCLDDFLPSVNFRIDTLRT